MVIQQATFHAVEKPWGRKDLHPWNSGDHGGARIGEIWFGRDGSGTEKSRLLLKILFTSEPLSIQVHPDDRQARAVGEPNGKTEAWYVLAAGADARVALGPTRSLTAVDLRRSAEEGNVNELVRWMPAVVGDVFVVPAGTIHAIGAGLVIVEIQQRCDITFRLFDHGRLRGLQVENAVRVAQLNPVDKPAAALQMSEGRTAIAVTPFFVLERVELAAKSICRLKARRETWVLALHGDIDIAGITAGVGDAIFLSDDTDELVAGANGAVMLIAYAHDRPEPDFLLPLPARMLHSINRPKLVAKSASSDDLPFIAGTKG